MLGWDLIIRRFLRVVAPILDLLAGSEGTRDRRRATASALLPHLMAARAELAALAVQFYRGEQSRHGRPPVGRIMAEWRDDYRATYLDHVLERVLPSPSYGPRRTLADGSPARSGGRVIDMRDIRTLRPAVVRHAQMAARSHTMRLIDEDPGVLGWARAPTGAETCAFCWMLISRGPVYKSERSARDGENGETYHPRCDCVPVPVFDAGDWPGRNSYLSAREIWNTTTRGYSGRDALNAFRRAVHDPSTERLPRAA